jgi:NADH-quinone oxidoreductase subunit E
MEHEEKIQEIAERFTSGAISLIGVLQETSKIFGYLPEDVLTALAERMEVPISRMYSLATFYSSFRLEPIGREHICVCVGTACHVRGAPQVVGVLERELKLEAGQTSEDLSYTLETVNCLGACALGPLVTINGDYHGKQDQSSILKLIRQSKKAAQE